MKKIIALVLTLSMLTLVFAGCAPKQEENPPEPEQTAPEEKAEEQDKDKGEKEENEKTELKVSVLSGPTAISMAKLLEEKPSMGGTDIKYEVVTAPDVMTARIVSKEADFAVVPTNLGAKLHNKGLDYKLAASTVWGVLYLVSSEEITSWEDLKDKKIATIGKGLTPDILFRYLATENGMKPDEDFNISYIASPQELAQTMIAGKNTVAVMPEPLLSAVLMKNKDVKVRLDLQKEWEKITGDESYPQSSLIVKGEIVEKYPEIVDEFLNKYKENIGWVNENPAEAGKIIEGLDIGLKAKLAEKAIPGSNLKYVGAKDARSSIEGYLKVLKDFSPDSIGGELPKDEFYMEK